MRARETVRQHGTTTPGSVDPLCPFLRILAPFPGPVPSPTIPAPSLTPRLHLVLCSLIAHSSHSFAAPAPSPTPFSREERGRGGMQALDTQLPLLSLSLSRPRALSVSLSRSCSSLYRPYSLRSLRPSVSSSLFVGSYVPRTISTVRVLVDPFHLVAAIPSLASLDHAASTLARASERASKRLPFNFRVPLTQ